MKTIINNYNKYRENLFNQRLISSTDLHNYLERYSPEKIGTSVLGAKITKIVRGSGKKKIAIWTQMHGNESTATLAILDLLNFLQEDNPIANTILQETTICIIPMVNPDGSDLYQRRNAMHIDINRDFIKKQAVETNVLIEAIEDFNPMVCFNMHDQRTIFNVAGTSNPATVSFLAPSEDIARTITSNRKKAMGIIAAMNTTLQEYVPNHIGRYTDEFYPNAFGDNLQKNGYITVLFEAGGYHNDLERQKTRELNWIALISGLYYIATQSILEENYLTYETIPQNDQKMMDIIYRNVTIKLNDTISLVDIGIMLNEQLDKELQSLQSFPRIEQIGDLSHYFGYEEIDAKGQLFSCENRNYPILNQKSTFRLV